MQDTGSSGALDAAQHVEERSGVGAALQQVLDVQAQGALGLAERGLRHGDGEEHFAARL